MWKWATGLGRFIAINALIASLTFSTSAIAGSQDAPVRIGASRTALLIFLADELDYFAEEGVDVEIETYNSGKQSLLDVLSGEIDLGTSSDFAVVSGTFDRPDLRILTSLSQSRTVEIVTRGDRGITSFADLQGRRVATTFGSSAQYFLGRSLEIAGVRLSEIEMVDLRPAQIADAIVSGGVDAGYTWDPFVYKARQRLEGNYVELPGQYSFYYHFLLHGLEDWVAAHPDEARAILAAIARAEEYARNDPEKAMEAVTRRIDLDRDFVEYVWPRHDLELSLSQGLLRTLEDMADWRMRHGLNDPVPIPDYLEMMAAEPLAEVKPLAVSIFVNQGIAPSETLRTSQTE